MTTSDYREASGPDFTTREHLLFASALANVKLDSERGFSCTAMELDILRDLAVKMALHAPAGQGWEALGFAVFQIVEAQRGNLDEGLHPDMIELYWCKRAEMTDVLGPTPADASVPDAVPSDLIESLRGGADDDGPPEPERDEELPIDSPEVAAMVAADPDLGHFILMAAQGIDTR